MHTHTAIDITRGETQYVPTEKATDASSGMLKKYLAHFYDTCMVCFWTQPVGMLVG